MQDNNSLILQIAVFVIDALELDEDPGALAPGIVPMKEDPVAGISALELATNVGPAPFLIYHYRLDGRSSDGQSGAEQFQQAIATLERATELKTPGPRIVASATGDNLGLILATSPSVFRALTGIGDAEELEATEADLLPGPETAESRRAAASDLLTLLRDSNAAAARWLDAVGAASRLPDAPLPGSVEAGAEEAALALFVIDQESIADLLGALNLLVTSANQQVAAHQERRSGTGWLDDR